jgi:hypothetical protein
VTINLDYLCAARAYDVCVAQLARVWQHLPPAAIADVTLSLLSDVLKMLELRDGESIVRFVAAIGRDIGSVGPWAAVARPAIKALRYHPPPDLLWRWLAEEEGAALRAAAVMVLPPSAVTTAVAATKRSVMLYQCQYCKWIIPADKLAVVQSARCIKIAYPGGTHIFCQMGATDAPPA